MAGSQSKDFPLLGLANLQTETSFAAHKTQTSVFLSMNSSFLTSSKPAYLLATQELGVVYLFCACILNTIPFPFESDTAVPVLDKV